MKNKNLYYIIGGLSLLGVVYFVTKKKTQDVVVNLNPPMEVEEDDLQNNTSTNTALSILDKIKAIIEEVKRKNLSTPKINA